MRGQNDNYQPMENVLYTKDACKEAAELREVGNRKKLRRSGMEFRSSERGKMINPGIENDLVKETKPYFNFKIVNLFFVNLNIKL